jgi:hypothetical protein
VDEYETAMAQARAALKLDQPTEMTIADTGFEDSTIATAIPPDSLTKIPLVKAP